EGGSLCGINDRAMYENNAAHWAVKKLSEGSLTS
ncbi:MAG: hypothetical protein RL497_1637, partial [Pseudomonadota bacterium]